MHELIQLFQAHGVAAVFLGVFVEQLGAPIPAAPFLLLAGAQGAADMAYLARVLVAAVLGSVLADVIWFQAGRRFGRPILDVLCRISLSPDSCVRRTELSFGRRGAWTVMLAKFIPGASMLARPLAGAMGMSARAFFLLNLAGTLLWVGSSLAAGVLLRAQVEHALQALDALGRAALLVLVACLALYVAWRALRRIAVRRLLREVPRLPPSAVAQMKAEGRDLLLLDVRAAPFAARTRIAGAVPVPLGSEAFQKLSAIAPRAEMVAYCDCPGDLTSARAALQLAARGCRVHVLAGGIDAWQAAGLPMEEFGRGLPAQERPVLDWAS